MAVSLCCPAGAQDYPERKDFQDSAQGLSILYRGKQSGKYQFAYNGNVYWSTPEFQKGEVRFEDRTYSNVDLNIDALAQEVLVKYGDNLISIALPKEKTDWLVIDGVKYVNLQKQGVKDVPEGFFEVLEEGKYSAYRHVTKRLSSSVSDVNGSQIGYDDPDYRQNVYDFFEFGQTFWFKDADGNFTKYRNKRGLLKQFPSEVRRELKKQAAQANLGSNSVSLSEYSRRILKSADQ